MTRTEAIDWLRRMADTLEAASDAPEDETFCGFDLNIGVCDHYAKDPATLARWWRHRLDAGHMDEPNTPCPELPGLCWWHNDGKTVTVFDRIPTKGGAQ